MESELEKKDQDLSTEQDKTVREGYEPVQRNYQRTERPQRQRIHTQPPYNNERRYDNDGGSFRPEGFGEGLQSREQRPQRPYQPRFNNNQGGYQSRQQGNYRPHYNDNGDNNGEYTPRQYNNYRPQYNNNNETGNGYQPRQQGGYRPRYSDNNDGGGYQSRTPNSNYRPQYNENGEGGNSYQPRQQGNYQPRNNYQSRPQGYQSRGGNYDNRRSYDNNYAPRQYNNYRPRTADYDPNAKYSLKKRIEYSEENIDPTVPVRLNKYLANAGVCSRREADEYIQSGVVTVNGEVVKELGTKVMRTDVVQFNGRDVSLEKKVYVLLNKPKDYVTTNDDPQQRKTVMDLVKDAGEERIYSVGRLDRNTTGVLLLTNDGELASKLTHPKFLKKKVYHVYLNKNITEHDLQQIADGITLEDGEVHADAIEYATDNAKNQVGIEIHSGKNRIVRRIFESLGYRVTKLDRVQFAGLTKKNLRRGDWRYLTEKEVNMLRMGAFE